MLVGGPDALAPERGDVLPRRRRAAARHRAVLPDGDRRRCSGRSRPSPASPRRRSPERTLGAGPRAGETFAVEVPTHAATVLRLAQGALATLTVSFEARGQYLSGLVGLRHARARSSCPTRTAFGGDVILRHGRDDAEPVEYVSRGAQETRGLGIEELADALRRGTAAPRERGARAARARGGRGRGAWRGRAVAPRARATLAVTVPTRGYASTGATKMIPKLGRRSTSSSMRSIGTTPTTRIRRSSRTRISSPALAGRSSSISPTTPPVGVRMCRGKPR